MSPALTQYQPNRLTGYEVVLRKVTGETVRLGFTIRRSFTGLITTAQRLTPEQWAAHGVTDATRSTGNRGRDARIILEDVGTVCFSGETKFSLWQQQGSVAP